MIERLILTILFFSNSVHAEEIRPKSPTHLKSSHEIIFYDKKDLGFTKIGKIKEYAGILEKLDETKVSLQQPDLYLFPKEQKTAMTVQLCNRYADKIFGPSAGRTLKLDNTLKLFSTRIGNACEFRLIDSYTKSKLPHNYVILGFIHAQLTALVWTLENPISVESAEKMKNFWKTLK